MEGETECEIRWKIKRFGKFQESLQKKGWKLKGPFHTVDYYFQPKYGTFWNPNKKSVKAQEWKKPKSDARIYLQQYETVLWKGNTYKKTFPPFSKVKLYEGPIEVCKVVLRGLGFEEWMIIEKQDGRLWHHPKTKAYLAMEKIRGMGWTGRMNFVGKTSKVADDKMRRAIGKLGIPRRQVKLKMLVVTFAEKEGRMKRPSDKAKHDAREEHLLRETKEDFIFQKRLEKFKKKLEKMWKKQEKRRDAEETKELKKGPIKKKRTPKKKPTKVKKKVVKLTKKKPIVKKLNKKQKTVKKKVTKKRSAPKKKAKKARKK
ncbi:MAG: hypothetical protein GOV00_03195 [Candidatus Altiarchaeota archaeon]|nr:hypothetical protein [Candidatus Altiarchaeota archaeon]